MGKSFDVATAGIANPRTFHTTVTAAGAPANVIADCCAVITPTAVGAAAGAARAARLPGGGVASARAMLNRGLCAILPPCVSAEGLGLRFRQRYSERVALGYSLRGPAGGLLLLGAIQVNEGFTPFASTPPANASPRSQAGWRHAAM